MDLMSSPGNASSFVEQNAAKNEEVTNFSNQNVLIGAILAVIGNILISLSYQVSMRGLLRSTDSC
jgi:hypothetical protein